jgi:hypothetical protein
MWWWWWWWGVLFERADPEHGHDKGARLQGHRSNPRESPAGFDLYGARDVEFGIAPGGGFQTQFSSRRIGGMARLVHDCGSRAPQAAGIRVAAFFPWRGGTSWMSS